VVVRMRVSWFIATISISVLAFLANYLSNPSNILWANIITGLIVMGINLVFWLPVVAYLHKNRKLSFSSSVISSVIAAIVGSASTIGIIYLLLYATEQFQQTDSMMDQSTGYTSWTLGYIHYWPGIAYVAVLWGINGTIFWKLYGKFATNE
jgi:uncharacterized membrane protein YGL010W